MGILDSVKSIFSKSDKKKKKKAAGKKAAKITAPKKKKTKKASSSSISITQKTKGRKKAKQITSDPIDEAALGFSISLKADDAQSKKRGAIRIKVDGLQVYVHRLKKSYDVINISATGLGFKFEKPRIKSGVKIKMDLVLNGKKEATGVLCKVRQHERGNVGCLFIELDRAQDDAIHKLVLMGQKQQAARKAAQKDKDFKLPS